MNINSDGVSRQQFFKGSMLDNDQTYISYPMELTFEGKRSNRANLNNKLSGDVDIVNHDVSFPSTTITHVRGFKTTEKWTNKINTGTSTVGSTSMQLENSDSGALLNGSQFDGASLAETAGWVSFMFDASDGVVLTQQSQVGFEYQICNIWGLEPTLASSSVEGYSAIQLFVKRYHGTDDTSSTSMDYYMYMSDWRYSGGYNTRKLLGNTSNDDFKLYDYLGDTNPHESQRYLLITWNSDTSKVTVWSGHDNGDIVYSTLD